MPEEAVLLKMSNSELEELAGSNDPDKTDAQFVLSMRLMTNDHAAGMEWLRSAAFNNHGTAQYILGTYLYCGDTGKPDSEIGKPDYEEAGRLWRDAAKQNVFPAITSLYKLGIKYQQSGGQENSVRAVVCFRAAADEGHPLAMYHLGSCYMKGEGVEKNSTEGIRWLQQAGDLGSEEASAVLRQYMTAPPGQSPEYRLN